MTWTFNLISNFLSKFYFREHIWRYQEFKIFAWVGPNNFLFAFEPRNNSDSFDMYIVYEKNTFRIKKNDFFEKLDHVISRNSVHRISSYCRVIITRHRGCELYTPHVSVWNVIGGGWHHKVPCDMDSWRNF